MGILVLLSAGGLFAGLLLLRKVPVLKPRSQALPSQLRVSVIIPARNEEANLPMLLESLRSSANDRLQVLVVDDGSTDDTAATAVRYGATVITSTPLPPGWTGKTWACHQGAAAATGDTLFFLDADVRFVDEGYPRIVDRFAALPPGAALSILPFHSIRCWYEELSIFFNIMVAMAAGGFGKLDAPHLFGQSLLVRKEIYQKAGGHESVKGEILENLRFTEHVLAAGGATHTVGGRHTLEMRMFPQGLRQLYQSWQKAFAAGAGMTSPLVLALCICWLTSAMFVPFMLLAVRGTLWPAAAALYLLNVAQVAWYGRQLGTFRPAAALLYPIPLAFYFVTFAQSAWKQVRGTPVSWRGRQV
jgi:4,4'-diaponeurosporenoate glycosyltransferase